MIEVVADIGIAVIGVVPGEGFEDEQGEEEVFQSDPPNKVWDGAYWTHWPWRRCCDRNRFI